MLTEQMPTAVSRNEIMRLREGHRATEKLVFERLFNQVVNACRYYTADTMKAEDAAATAFIIAYTGLDRFVWQHEGSFYAWLRKIAVREALHDMRKERCFLELTEDIGHESPAVPCPDFKMDAAMELSLLDRLSPLYKAVFLLIKLEGCSHADCAELFNISESNSKQILRRARLKLIQVMETTNYKGNEKLGS
jgi:RNA polymerase sigma-70 factor (ECF subfamily)